MAARSEWTKRANPLRTDPVVTEEAQQEVEAFSAEAEAGAGASPEVNLGLVFGCPVFVLI